MNEKPDCAVHLKDCRLVLGRTGGQVVTFQLPEWRVRAGEQLAVTGPSGCGKSTLLNLISGLLTPSRGMVSVRGTDLVRLSPRERDAFRGKTIGFIYQNFHLLDGFSACENVLIGMRFGRSIPRAQQSRRARDFLVRVGLAQRLHARPSQLSAGERQRVAVARAVAGRPALLLADEPTGSLDLAAAGEVFDLIQEITTEENCTLLFVTHDPTMASRFPSIFQADALIHHAAEGDF